MAQSLNQGFGALDIEFPSQIGNMRFNHIRMVVPIEIVQMFQKLTLRYDDARAMNKILENSILGGRQI